VEMEDDASRLAGLDLVALVAVMALLAEVDEPGCIVSSSLALIKQQSSILLQYFLSFQEKKKSAGG
jgi:hypothetical protein